MACAENRSGRFRPGEIPAHGQPARLDTPGDWQSFWMSANDLIMRLLYGIVSVPKRVYDALYARNLRRYCSAAEGVELSATARILNPVEREAVVIGAHSLFM